MSEKSLTSDSPYVALMVFATCLGAVVMAIFASHLLLEAIINSFIQQIEVLVSPP